ncbi:hypothetical protein PIROE2DRAFT_7634 [Piromyces sp. E2]|nr:hypothetical protein PIROE2DRAFT_7634 [Piromyces sp. E2]|eukprot:OUM65337.1 hypothetical protein PIROE2DRAFT_7634 [Piromyces sp. E2]
MNHFGKFYFFYGYYLTRTNQNTEGFSIFITYLFYKDNISHRNDSFDTFFDFKYNCTIT